MQESTLENVLICIFFIFKMYFQKWAGLKSPAGQFWTTGRMFDTPVLECWSYFIMQTLLLHVTVWWNATIELLHSWCCYYIK